MKKHISAISILLALILLLSACGAAAPASDDKPAEDKPAQDDRYRVAMILPGQINDAGWSASAYNGMLKAAEDFQLETAYSENVSLTDAEAAFVEFASQGYDLVIAHGYDYTDAACKIGPKFPDVKFVVMNGTASQEPNVASYMFRSGENGFLGGVIAALMTKTNKVGMIVLNKSEKLQLALENFEKAAKWINPEIEVLTGYGENANDLAKTKELTLAMIEQGADIVGATCNAATMGAVEACKEKGVYFIGYVSDMNENAPETVLVSVVQEIPNLIYAAIADVLNGDFAPELVMKGVKEEQVVYSSFHEQANLITPEIQAKLDEVLAKFKDGSIYTEKLMITTPEKN